MTPKFDKFGAATSAFPQEADGWNFAEDDWAELIALESCVEPMATIRGFDWARDIVSLKAPLDTTSTDAYIQCQIHGLRSLHETVEISSDLRGGIPVLKGTRFTISQLVAELSDTSGPAEIAENFDLDEEQIKTFLDGLAMLMHKSYAK